MMSQTVLKMTRGKAPRLAPRRGHEKKAPGAPVRIDPRSARAVADVEELLFRYALGAYARDEALLRSCLAAPAPGGALPSESEALARAGLGPPDAGQHYYSILSLRVHAGEAEAVVHYRAGRGRQLDTAPFDPGIRFTYRCRRSPLGWQIVEISAERLPDSLEWGPCLDIDLDALDDLQFS